MKLQIPEQEKSLLRDWLLGEKPIERVLDALERAEPALTTARVAESVATLTELPSSELRPLLKSLVNACATYWNSEEPDRPEVIETLFTVIAEPGSEARKADFERLFNRIVRSKTIETTTKSRSILSDNQHLYCSARTLTESRPVFEREGLAPSAMVILHQLKLEYHEGNRLDRSKRSVFVAMDKKDLLALQKVIERALTKHERLVDTLKKLELPILGES